ncbi:MAG: ferrous iron transport protein A [Clostridia bacterium]|nr:ferrous iron transport protein A [Clostridia bacterium]
MQTLCQVKEKEEREIEEISGPSFQIERRLYELGFLPGKKVEIIKQSFSKKTILVRLDSFCLALRCGVADYVRVK